jgi:hypothetical protein
MLSNGLMDNESQTPTEGFCPRCKVAVTKDVRRCPQCGERISRTSKAPIYIGVVGLLALLFAGLLMIKTIKDSDKGAGGDGQTVSRPAAQPDKVPPLNR